MTSRHLTRGGQSALRAERCADETLPDGATTEFFFESQSVNSSQGDLNHLSVEYEARSIEAAVRGRVCLLCGSVAHGSELFCQHDGEPLRDTLTPFHVQQSRERGTVLDGRYLIGDRLSVSRHAVVVAARHVHLAKDVVLKFLSPGCVSSGAAAQRLRREAIETARLRHDRIVEVLDFGVDHGNLPYLVMERLNGQCLEGRLSQRGRLTCIEVASLGAQICEALAYIHGQGIMHRDMKPSNVWCQETADGSLDIKLLDFGLCKALTESGLAKSLTEPGSIVGTPNYMAPEQSRGESLDERADLYSLGCILWEACTGRPLVRGRSLLDCLTQHNGRKHPNPSSIEPSVSSGLESVIMKALHRERHQRWQSAHAMHDALMSLIR